MLLFEICISNCELHFTIFSYENINDYHLSVQNFYIQVKRDPFLQHFLSHSTAHS